MLSDKLITAIENSSGKIAAAAASHIREDHFAPTLAIVEKHKLCDWEEALLRHLRPWLLGENHDEIAAECCEAAGRFQREGVPLLDVMRGLNILKRTALNFERDLGLDRTAFEIYMEEEFERGLGEYFDFVAWHTVRGYEEQLALAGERRREKPAVVA